MNFKKEILNYIIFGIFTSIVNTATYLLTWVFESENKNIIKEISMFYSARLFTGVIDTSLMILFIDVLSLENTFSKLVTAVVVILLNYLFSKKIIFKKV